MERYETSAAADIRYELHDGVISQRHRDELLPLRLTCFSDFPYLYCGNPEKEAKLWDALSSDTTILVLAYDGQMLVGAIIAQQLSATDCATIQQRQSCDRMTSIELDMIMIDKDYQSRGIGKRLVHLFEQAARDRGYAHVYGCVVERSANHPLKPAQYIDLQGLWRHMGYVPTDVVEPCNWMTRCGVPGNEFVAPIDNLMRYWHKQL